MEDALKSVPTKANFGRFCNVHGGGCDWMRK